MAVRKWAPTVARLARIVAPSTPSAEQREEGFLERMNELCPDAEWVSTDKYAGATRDSAMREAKPLVLQFKDRSNNVIGSVFEPFFSTSTNVRITHVHVAGTAVTLTTSAVCSTGRSQRMRASCETEVCLRTVCSPLSSLNTAHLADT